MRQLERGETADGDARGKPRDDRSLRGADGQRVFTGKIVSVEIDGAEAVSLTFDAATGKTDAIAAGDYAGWGFAVEDSVLKFKKLA